MEHKEEAEVLAEFSALPEDFREPILMALNMMVSCAKHPKNHGVFAFVENEDTLSVLGVNAQGTEMGFLLASAMSSYQSHMEMMGEARRNAH